MAHSMGQVEFENVKCLKMISRLIKKYHTLSMIECAIFNHLIILIPMEQRNESNFQTGR